MLQMEKTIKDGCKMKKVQIKIDDKKSYKNYYYPITCANLKEM